MYHLQEDINIACEGDEKDIKPILAAILPIVTLGLYFVYWFYKQGDRVYKNANKYGLPVTDKGSDYAGIYLLCLCTYIGFYIDFKKMIENTNMIFDQYNDMKIGKAERY